MSNETKNSINVSVERVLSLLSNGYDDYLASRTLLNHNQILQGVVLANTAIEKYFKGILTLAKIKTKHSHSIKNLIPSIKNFDIKLFNRLNIDFIMQVDSCYVLRYIDSAPENFHIALRRNQILSELDFSISMIEEKININAIDGRKYMTKYSSDKVAKRHELVNNNYLFQNIAKESFLIGEDYLYEIWIHSNKQFTEVKYQTYI